MKYITKWRKPRNQRKYPAIKPRNRPVSNYEKGRGFTSKILNPGESQAEEFLEIRSTKTLLCQWCKNLELVKNFAYTPEDIRDGGDGVSLRRKPHEFDGSCSLCKLILTIMENQKNKTHIRMQSENGIYLHHYKSDAFFGHNESSQDNTWQKGVVIAVVPATRNAEEKLEAISVERRRSAFRCGVIIASGSLEEPERPEYIGRKTIRKRPNIPLLRSWIQHCNKPDSTEPPAQTHVIDCWKNSIIPLRSTMRYLALSYVWGSEQDDRQLADWLKENKRKLPRILPNTVADAVIVTVAVDERYLWVDRYCIPSWVDKDAQINNMDRIYAGAVATIVSLSADPFESSASGLFGISRPRDAAPRVPMNSGFLTTSLPHLSYYLEGSTWASRAWTFQEDSLSKRCLFFTKDQVIFSSEEGLMYEGLKQTIKKNETAFGTIFEDQAITQGLTGSLRRLNHSIQIKSGRDILEQLLAQYTTRNISNESDILKAFLGILHATARPHFYGIFCRKNGSGPFVSPSHAEMAFKNGLCWFTGARVRNAYNSPVVRPGFPSWSWTKVKSEIKYRLYREEEHRQVPSTISILLKNDPSGQWRPIGKFFEENKCNNYSMQNTPPWLRIRSFCTRVSLRNSSYDNSIKDGSNGSKDAFHGGWQAWTSRVDMPDKWKSTTNHPAESRSEPLGDVKIDSFQSEEFLSRICNESWDAILIQRTLDKDKGVANWDWLLLDRDGPRAKRVGLITTSGVPLHQFPVFRCLCCPGYCPHSYDNSTTLDIPAPHGDPRIWTEELILE